MDKSPFSPTTKEQDPLAVRRRSTRIDFVTTVLLSGKDGSGTPFREYTQTARVNLHGCKIRTSYRILVGMLVNLECPKAGASGKAVCIQVWDPKPGIAGHEIALQLIKPQNLWGVPNPPADWETVAKAMVQGRAAQTEGPARPGGPVVPVAVPRAPAIPPVAAPAPPAVVAARQAPMTGPTIEQRLADLERRSTQLVDSVIDILRGQAEEITRNSLDEFRQQVDALIKDAEVRLRQDLQQAYEQSAGSLISLRADLMEQMASRSAQMIRSAEDTLRTRLRTQLATEDKAAPAKPPEPVAKK
jgi:ElaB/YqjD/DUF883 family membrane-anchored ribosome-binding protein